MGVVVLIACPLDYTLLKLQVSLENEQDASRIDATPSLVTLTRTGVCEVQDFPDGWKLGNSWNPSKSGLA